MNSYTPTLDISVRFDAPTDIVWAALTDERCTAEWWPSLELAAKRGGRAGVITPRPKKKRPRTARGRVAELDAGHEIVLAIESTPRGFESTVTITVTRAKGRTKVRVVESGLPSGHYAELVAAECRDGWREVLGALDDHLAERRNVERIRARLGGS
ncbi:MAG: SRPBCC domain-containing protein [Microbacteriaceae bacterium]|nr:SRPBCC domain-containing protein [Microbacteriaceae bacterium]